MLEMTRTDPEWKDKIITGDETWVYDYDPETKRQYAEWRGQDIAPNDFFLFPKLKAVLKGRHFDTRDDIIEKSLLALKSIPKELYKNCFDNLGKRWRCKEFKDYLEGEGIGRQLSVEYTPQQNGVAERANRTLLDMTRCFMIEGTKWVFKTKCNSDGSVERHKARLVAKGYSQQYGIDYEETFAPVVRQSTIRMFLALAVEYNLILHQMDVQSAYLNGEIKEEIYMTQPENFVSRKYPEKVCRLKKAIYGLKQAGIVWHEKLDNELKNLGLKQLQSDNCVYIKHDEGILLVAIYVDDLIIAAEREDTLKSFKESMKRIFKIKDLGGINCCLGIRIQMKEDGSISIDQERYIEELLAKYRMKEAKPISTPMDSNSKLTKISSIEVSTRPDIAYAVSALGQFSNDPRRQHWNAAKRVLRYLKGTSCLRITYRKSNEALHGYADADWGGNLVDRKSHTGIVYFLARGPIAWESKKQQTVTLSSTESEYIALCEAGKEAVYLRALLDEMGFGELLNGPTVLKTDNQGAQQLARNPVYHARTKHIDIKWHYIRSICSDGLVEVVHTPTQENVADILTKGLPRFLYEKHVTGFGM
ncbi:hypothetical protein LAZ67_2006611 [Cordylochernes scorpioides]|uniref:Integrase catalytic domain-containing protein n=1 Tax=Cordylochernes scorpioides TaxID=51811 RepID=A0ABY6K8U4_9ARAC|nr:hypothetical protein LAZ67_2006611 [Cordylochernes scorpioides]